MLELQTAIINRLTGDASLMALLPGAVWDRWLLPSGPGNTAAAWTTDASGVKRLQPCLIVPDPDIVPHPSDFHTWDYAAFDAFPVLTYFAQALASAKQTIEAADARVQALLHHWRFALNAGPAATVTIPPQRLGFVDNPEYPGIVQATRQLRITSLQYIQAVSA